MKDKTYFTEVASVYPHFIIAGHTDDICCNNSLQITTVEQELHRHLKEQGFEAVIFYNRNLKIYSYDQRSIDIVLGVNTEQQQNNSRTQSAYDDVDLRADGPLGIDFDEPEATNEPNRAETRVANNRRLCLNTLRVEAAWDNIATMLRSNRKTAVVISNMNAMVNGGINQFPANALSVLTELGEISAKNHSIAIYNFRGLDFATLEKQLVGNADEWNRFVEACIRPLICRSNDSNDSSGVRRHIIRVDTPNAAHIRNLLLYFRLRSDKKPLNIKTADIEKTAISLAYGCCCAKKPIILKELRDMIERFIQANPNHNITAENCHILIGRKNNNTAMQDLKELIGLDGVKKNLEGIFELAKQEGFTGVDMPEDFSPFAPMADAIDLGLSINVCLLGEKGTGKTEVANLLGRIYYEAGVLPTAKVVALRPSDIITGGIGDSGRNMAEAVQRAMGGVLFIDEAYGLSKEKAHGAGEEAITQLVGDMTAYKGRLAVVIAGYKDDIENLLKDNEGLKSRFPEQSYYNLEPYSWKEIMAILKLMAEKDDKDVTFEPDTEENGNWLANFCENWVGNRDADWGNAREAENLLKAMKQNYALRPEKEGKEVGRYVLSVRDIPEKHRACLKPRTNDLAEAIEKLDSLIGLDGPKRFLKNLCGTIRWNREFPEPGNYLFIGPPGTGKTFFADSMCEILHHMHLIRRRNPVKYNASDLMNGKVTVSNMIKEARGTLLFIDEAHQLCDEHSGQRVIRELVPIIEDPAVRADTCVVLAGYQDEMMHLLSVDAGLASRFESKNHIRFVNYTAEELVQLLELFLKDAGYTADEKYYNRSLSALNRYLETVENEFGNARYIRKEYIPNSIARHTKRLNKTYLTDLDEKEREYAIPDEKVVKNCGEDTRCLTELDIPEEREDDAGPLGMPPAQPRTADVRLAELVGKEKVREYVEAFKNSTGIPEFFDSQATGGMHYVIQGPPGSGRHTVARLLASVLYEAGRLSNERPISKSQGDFEGRYLGETVQKTRDVINASRGNMLIVESPSILLGTDNSDNMYGMQALSTLVGAMSSERDISIVFIDTAEGIDALIKSANGIRDRAKCFELEDLSPYEMQTIFEKLTENSFTFDEETKELIPSFFLNWVSERGGLGERTSAWGNGTEVEALINDLRESWTRVKGEKVFENGIPKRQITKEMFPQEMQKYLVSTMVKHEDALKELKDMVGLTAVKKAVIKLERRLRRADKSCTIPGCYCFLGNPGTGKTTVARMMGGVFRATGILSQGHVIERSAASFATNPDLYNEAVKLAKNGILFIDEAHQMCETGGGQEVIRRLVRDLEDANLLKVTSIILAGYPEKMRKLLAQDQGLNRRFGNESSIIYFEDYTPDELVEILKHKAKIAAKEPQICAPCEVKLTEEYIEASRRAFRFVCDMKRPDFGNGGFVRTYLNDSVDCLLERLDAEETIDYLLTAEDIPERYRKALESKKIMLPANLPAAAVRTAPIGENVNEKELKEFSAYVTVLLETYKDGVKLGSGSGAIITDSGHILTCAHVLENADAVKAKLYCPNNVGKPFVWLDCEILHPVAQDIDMAILKMEGNNFPVASLRTAVEEIDSTESIMLAGYSLGSLLTGGDSDALTVSHKIGRVSSIQTSVNRYYSDITGLHGDSGGPVFSMEDGRIVGVFTGSIAPGEGSLDEFNFFHPISCFWDRFVDIL